MWLPLVARTVALPCAVRIASPAIRLSAAVPAALAAPLASSIGQVLFWERWTGSALMLNLFKCTLASALFVGVLAFQWLAGRRWPH